jgi:ATP-binding cassette subfamily B protein/subfamily B ATP-binding cassette protein MsbA
VTRPTTNPLAPTKAPPSSRARYAAYLHRRKTDPAWATQSSDVAHGAPKRDRNARELGLGALLRELFARTREHRAWLILSLCTLTLTALLGLVLPAATKVAIDYIATDNPGPSGLPLWAKAWANVEPDGAFASADRKRLLVLLGIGMVGVTALAVTLGTIARWQITRVTKRVQASWRERAFTHALRLPLHRIQHYKTGGMASLLREDAGLAGELLFSLIFSPWRAIVQLFGTLAVLAWTDYRMLLGGLLLLPTVWITHRAWITRIRPVLRDAKQVRTTADAVTTEAFAGVRVLRAFGRSKSAGAAFVRSQHYMARLEVLSWWWSRMTDVAWALLIPTATAGVLVYGGSRVVDGSLTIGDVMMFSTYLLMLLGPLETLVSTASGVQTNLAAFDRFLALLSEPTEFCDAPQGKALEARSVRGEIRVSNVSYRYPSPRSPKPQASGGTDAAKATGAPSPPEAPPPAFVLSGVSFTIPAGSTLALVGPSGSGKTTLCNLIARFDDPTSGVITLDGTDLRDIRVSDYRSLLGIVEQEVFLFDGSISDNIAYAKRDATREEIIAAARAAAAHEFILQVEGGYDAVIGERGVRLSGGQRQRLAIARALLANPRILILDEATSNLDSESEQRIQASLAALRSGRTCITIAHRLSTIRSADRILVLDKGTIAEQGTHAQLLAAGGLYAKLVGLQQDGKIPELTLDENGKSATPGLPMLAAPVDE